MSPDEPTPARHRGTEPRRSPGSDAQLRAAVAARLSGQERLVVMLSYSERLSTREIAAVLGVGTGQIAEIRSRIVRHCRDAAAQGQTAV